MLNSTEYPVRFGLLPLSNVLPELARTVLPLKSVRYSFIARGGIAQVELTQIYRQENDAPFDCEYVFPLPADGAVSQCEAVINDRTIRARIEEKEKARELAKQAKSEGHRTLLVESERENLFTLSLGNVQPQDIIEVKFSYLQPLRQTGRNVSLDLPLSPGERYIPGKRLLRSNRGTGIIDDTDQVPDASRLNPPLIDSLHPDAAFVELAGTIELHSVDGAVRCVSHAIQTERSDSEIHVALAKGGEIPAGTIALRWSEPIPDTILPRGWISAHQGHHYALLELRAPSTTKNPADPGQDFYFLIDRSGSMEGPNWTKAVEALHSCVRQLGPNDRAWVTLFESDYQDFGSEPVAATELMADSSFLNLSRLGVAGGTELAPAIKHVLAQTDRFSQDRPAALVLITDAQIGNDAAIPGLLQNYPKIPIHCFGIDARLNDALLIELVRQQGGTFRALQPHEDVSGAVTEAGIALHKPVVTGCQISPGWEPAASAIPNLYTNQVVYLSVRSTKPGIPPPLFLDAIRDTVSPIRLEFNPAPVSDPTPWLQWAKARLAMLSARSDTRQAVGLSEASGLLCRFTAFVAWDDAEQVPVATRHILQPSMDDTSVACNNSAPLDNICNSAAKSQTAILEFDYCAYLISRNYPMSLLDAETRMIDFHAWLISSTKAKPRGTLPLGRKLAIALRGTIESWSAVENSMQTLCGKTAAEISAAVKLLLTSIFAASLNTTQAEEQFLAGLPVSIHREASLLIAEIYKIHNQIGRLLDEIDTEFPLWRTKF